MNQMQLSSGQRAGRNQSRATPSSTAKDDEALSVHGAPGAQVAPLAATNNNARFPCAPELAQPYAGDACAYGPYHAPHPPYPAHPRPYGQPYYPAQRPPQHGYATHDYAPSSGDVAGSVDAGAERTAARDLVSASYGTRRYVGGDLAGLAHGTERSLGQNWAPQLNGVITRGAGGCACSPVPAPLPRYDC